MCGTWVGDFSPAAMNGFDEIPTKIQFVNNKVESLIQTLHSAVQSYRAYANKWRSRSVAAPLTIHDKVIFYVIFM